MKLKCADILVVDDDGDVRGLISNVLNRDGHETLEAEDGLAAYELLPHVYKNLRVVITDLRMPRMTGLELIERVKKEYPSLKCLCISGYAESPSLEKCHFLAKPFKPGDLLASVRRVLDVCAKAAYNGAA